MVVLRWLLGAALAGVLAVAVPGVAQAAPTGAQTSAAAAAATIEADWQLNEPAGSTDDGRLDGPTTTAPSAPTPLPPASPSMDRSTSGPSAARPAHPPRCRASYRCPTRRLDIPDPSVTWTAEFRFKTNKGYGNIMQKGQATDPGGQIKIENPNGFTQCVFIGANRSYVAVASPIRLNDNQWHDFKCVHTATQIQVWVDGVAGRLRELRHRTHRQRLALRDRWQEPLRPGQGDLRLLHRRDRLGADHPWRRASRGPASDGCVQLGVRRAVVHASTARARLIPRAWT